MEGKFYTAEKSQQIVISLLKAHGIKKVIASPGTTNYTLVASMQQDPWFEMYSSVDERSAAYLACGMACESGEPVVITCTGATASRNYMPGLTEAFYRKLPVLAITASQGDAKIGHHIAQVIDRRVHPNDLVKLSVSVPICKDSTDEWSAVVKVNEAILELTRDGGGPVHINLDTNYSRDFSIKELPPVRVIKRYTIHDKMPSLPKGRIGIFVGAHPKMSDALSNAIDGFCQHTGAVVFCDHTSGYYGKYRVDYSLVCSQDKYFSDLKDLSLLIHMGEVSGEYYGLGRLNPKNEWRVNPDGKLRDRWQKLTSIFEMNEEDFFSHYLSVDYTDKNSMLQDYTKECDEFYSNIPELPFSNIWIASQLADLIPSNSCIHFGILGSLRAWNFFRLPEGVESSSNVGGFGIDGGVSTLIGASLVNSSKLYFGVFGDLAFFYDMNSLGNRHIANNLRIMLVNNGKGAEFRLYWHPAAAFKEDADAFMAAGGHFGNKSANLVKHYAEDLGFEYISASSKEEFTNVYSRFVNPELTAKPILFEVFTNSSEENEALFTIRNMAENSAYKKQQIKKSIIKFVGPKLIKTVKKIIK